MGNQKLMELRGKLQGLNLWVPTKLERGIIYGSINVLEVHEADFPGSHEEMEVSPFVNTAIGYLEDVDDADPDREGTMVIIPYYKEDNGEWKINYKVQHLHVFDSQYDFSGTSLPGEDAFDSTWDDIEFNSLADHLEGGVYGWSYGIWAGDENWDESKFYEEGADYDDS